MRARLRMCLGLWVSVCNTCTCVMCALGLKSRNCGFLFAIHVCTMCALGSKLRSFFVIFQNKGKVVVFKSDPDLTWYSTLKSRKIWFLNFQQELPHLHLPLQGRSKNYATLNNHCKFINGTFGKYHIYIIQNAECSVATSITQWWTILNSCLLYSGTVRFNTVIWQ